MTHTGSDRSILLVGLVFVGRVSKFIIPVLYRRIAGGEFFIPVFCMGRGGTESGRVRGRRIIIFEIVVPVFGRSTLGRAGVKDGPLFLDRTRRSSRLINEVIIPVFGYVVLFENALGRRHSRIGTVEIESLVPILWVVGYRNLVRGV